MKAPGLVPGVLQSAQKLPPRVWGQCPSILLSPVTPILNLFPLFCQDGFPAPRGSSDIAASGLRKLHRTDREKAAVSHHTSAFFTVYFPAAVY